jgi:microcystin degradation protein MlrC
VKRPSYAAWKLTKRRFNELAAGAREGIAKMRIALVGMYHETNTFALERNNVLDAAVQTGNEMIDQAHPRNFMGGFLEVGREKGFEFAPTSHVKYIHGGLIEAHVYKHYRDAIVQQLQDAGEVDGVYFCLHGAMAAEDPYTDAEGDLIAACRAVTGPDIPFVATYDFHAILSPEECANLAAAFPNDTNPHIDGYERGREAADCMAKILRGEINPVTRVVHVPIIGPNIGQSTWAHNPEEEQRLPLFQLNQLRAEMEQTSPGIINLTVMGGYGYADTPHSCMSVVATADGDANLAEAKAKELAQAVWEKRENILNVRPYVSIDEGVKKAMAHEGERPIVLVDLGDDPGSACVADSPAVLEALLRLDASNAVLTVRDPEGVKKAINAGVGAELELDVGASIDSRFYKPVRVKGHVKLIDDGNYMICGPTHGGWGREVHRDAWREANVGPRAVIRTANKVDVILVTPWQGGIGKDRDFFKSAGIVFDEKRMIVVKSNQAHRASFDPITDGNIDLASPGASTVDYGSLPYRHIPRPLWPVDRDFDWNPDEGVTTG